ncbi:type III pantothenate kinase [Flavobacterium sp. ASW18X]|uniref:type III pantothenate kinase n=1 Tax=Flavobacterium sp. ASW18X TaxID=2572595 RepID=UPI0010AE4946|nr:type III pantothenate kinase [Flavobacterium sp. ASW18X]TKD60980.1 type III pantothenate kinase [Flavobacterium sp. ASW18X]
MNLVVDKGNTQIKYGIFNKNKLIDLRISPADQFLKTIKSVFEDYPSIARAMLSSVGGLENNEYKTLTLFCKTHLLTSDTNVPFKNSYATPNSLGVDRLALATAAYYHNPKGNTLVIDMGTCITYDVVNDYGEYLGGAISPGLQMRYKAMHHQTKKLPLLAVEPLLDFIGNSTETSMHSGVVNGITQELDGVINQYRARFQDLTVILTGGDGQFFAKRVKNSIFAHSKFLLEGLNYLLEYNKL